MDDQQLFDLFVQKGFLTKEKAQNVLRDAQFAEKDPEMLLYESRAVDPVAAAQAKSERLGIPYKKVHLDDISAEVLAFIPPAVSSTYYVVPLSATKDTLIVGMLKPADRKAQDALRFVGQQHKRNLGVYVISYTDFQDAYQKYSPFKTEVDEALRSVEEQTKGSKELVTSYRMVTLESSEGEKESAPIIRLVASIFKNAVIERASDIHVEPERSRVRVRFRVDGDLHEALSIPQKLHQPIISRIKVLSDLKIDENRRPQDGRFRTEIFNKEIDFRVSTLPTAVGEKAVLRVLDPTAGLKSLGELGLVGKNFDTLSAAIKKPYGMILITGPTGSGKTTTLYSILQFLNQEDVNVITLEDPVEYTIEGLNQSQMMPEIGYTFASGLRQVLRQDPDIIMVGEIRDSETAGLAVHAALTGHLVLSTLHTNNAAGVAPRLIDMRVEPFLLPPALNVMLAQRLVGRLCPDCKKAELAPPDIQDIIAKELATLPKDIQKEAGSKPYSIYHAAGCDACKHKGTRGRMALFEVLVMTPALAEIISAGITAQKMTEEIQRQGMISLRQDGILKALRGDVNIEEALRETSENR